MKTGLYRSGHTTKDSTERVFHRSTRARLLVFSTRISVSLWLPAGKFLPSWQGFPRKAVRLRGVLRANVVTAARRSLESLAEAEINAEFAVFISRRDD